MTMSRKHALVSVGILLFWGIATYANIISPEDFIRGVPDDGDWPAVEAPHFAIDGNVHTKYLHFKGSTQPTGFQITPRIGGTIVAGLAFTTANDAPERDPVAFELSGSNEGIDGPYTLIARGYIVDFARTSPWPRFTRNATPIAFSNTTAYTHYQLLFTGVRDPSRANSMQIAEVEFLGDPAWALPPEGDPGQSDDPFAGPSIVISEIKAVNRQGLSTVVEGRTVYPDWLELHNRGRTSVNLAGWYLTDSRSNLTKWEMPAVQIPQGGFLVIFASGIQEEDHPTNWPYRDQAGNYHTNFKLSSRGEYLGLVGPDLEVVHEYGSHIHGGGFGPQRADLSYGLYGNEPQYFTTLTPGRANSPGYPSVSDDPVFSREGGTFNSFFLLELSSSNPQAEIRFTIDGQIPTRSSPLYTDPIIIIGTKEVLARAYEPGKAPSAVASRTYVALADDVLNFNSNLPIVVVDGLRHSPGNTKAKAVCVFIDTGDQGRARITDPAVFDSRAGIRRRGSSTRWAAKGSYALEIWDEDNEDKEVSLFGIPATSDWVLYAPFQFDRALISNAFMYHLSNQIGRYAVRTRFVEMFLNINDDTVSSSDYVGLYILMERIKRGEERVDVDKLYPWDSTEPRITGGYMLKIDRRSPGDSGFRTARGNPTYGGGIFCYVNPKERNITAAQSAWIRGYLNAFEDALYGPNFADPHAGYAKYIDVDSFIDHNLINMLAMNVDALRLSTHMFMPRGGKLQMGPIWDFDRALGSTDSRDNNPQAWRGTGDATDYHRYPWWDRLFQDGIFWQKYIDRWFVLRRGPFSTASLNATIDAMAEEIWEAQARNFQRWSSHGPRYGGYQGEINQLKQWLQTRCTWVDSQFAAPPQILPDGGYVEAGTVVHLIAHPDSRGLLFYTLDGSDPYLSQPEDVYLYTGPFTITESTQIKARTLVTGNRYSPWSGLARAIFMVGPRPESVRISEIMYHPPSSGRAEYVELLNVADSAITLYDPFREVPWRFTVNPENPTIDFLFPTDPPVTLAPGERLLLVRDLEALHAAYSVPPDVQILEWGSGRLANSSDTIQLSSPGDENVDGTRSWIVADRVTYSDGSHPEYFADGFDPWPREADGRGMALGRIDLEADGDDFANWLPVTPSPGVAK